MAVASLDKIITIWNFNKEVLVLTIDMAHGGIHSMIYSTSYQTLITAGYEKSINLIQIDPEFLDYGVIGKLTGHTAMITAIQVIEKSPMVISGDDQGTIKLWDIRSLKCLQTLSFGQKTIISKFIDISDQGMIGFIGSRVHLMNFDDKM